MLDINLLQDYYRLKNLVRYNQMPRLSNESVAEHSYYVALFTDMICDELDSVDENTRLLAIRYALCHDLPEVGTSDIPYPVKAKYKDISDSLRLAEHEFMESEFPSYYDLFISMEPLDDNINELDDSHKVARTIVKLADIISVVQYAYSQVQLGNTHFEPIFSEGTIRYSECLSKLERTLNEKVTLFNQRSRNE